MQITVAAQVTTTAPITASTPMSAGSLDEILSAVQSFSQNASGTVHWDTLQLSVQP